MHRDRNNEGGGRRGGHGPRRQDAGELSPDVVLAALARAELHAGRHPAPVAFWTLLDHLSLARRSPSARAVRQRIAQLESDALVTVYSRHGVPVFACTETGAARLTRLRDRRALPPLPESPQHERWRLARVLAAQELARFRAGLESELEVAQALLESDASAAAPHRSRTPVQGERPSSDDWFALASRLRTACRRVGSAIHVLHEWREPSDERADVDDLDEPRSARLDAAERARRRAARAGRRNPRLWRDEPS